MAEIDDLGNTVVFEKKPRTHKLGKNEYPLDDSVVNNPNWYTFEDASVEAELSISYIKTISGELKWPKKYAMVKGVMFTFVEKTVVKKFIESRRPIELEPKIQEAETKPHLSETQSPNISDPNKDGGLPNNGGGVENPPALNLTPATVQLINEKVGQLVKATFKEELKNIQEGVEQNRKENTFWKIFALSIVIVLLGGTSLIVLNFNRINKTILDMTADLINQKEAVFKSQAVIQQKDFEIKFLQDQINKNPGTVNNTADVNKEVK